MDMKHISYANICHAYAGICPDAFSKSLLRLALAFPCNPWFPHPQGVSMLNAPSIFCILIFFLLGKNIVKNKLDFLF
jgi:hypothetical protein